MSEPTPGWPDDLHADLKDALANRAMILARQAEQFCMTSPERAYRLELRRQVMADLGMLLNELGKPLRPTGWDQDA